MSDSSVKTWLQWTRAANPPHNSTVDITLTFGRFIRGRNPIWYILNHVMPSPSINIQSFPQKQEKKKVSFAEAYPPPAALSSQHTGKPQQSRVGEGERRLFLSPLNHFTHPRFSNCLTPLSRSVGRRHPPSSAPSFLLQFRCASALFAQVWICYTPSSIVPSDDSDLNSANWIILYAVWEISF